MADALASPPGFGAAYRQRRRAAVIGPLSGSRRFLESPLATFRGVDPDDAHAPNFITEAGAERIAVDDLQNRRSAGQADDKGSDGGTASHGLRLRRPTLAGKNDPAVA